MASNQDLTKEFQKFVGITIKEPYRMSADMDTSDGVALSDLASQKGLTMGFFKPGNVYSPSVSPPPASPVVVVNITKDGLPPADKPWGWRVQSIDIK